MSYDPKYQEWVEKTIGEDKDSNELHKIHRGVPIVRVKIRDNPPTYRFIAPIVKRRTGRVENIIRRIDRQLEKDPSGVGADDASYFQKWQDCQIELSDLKRRETRTLSQMKELRDKVEELNSAQVRLQKEAAELKRQLESSKALISELNKK